MIRAESITKTFSGVGEPIRSLRDVSVTVERGSIFGLIGSNGSGKSTFLRILSGVYEPDAGDVRIDGVHVFENPAVKSRIVYLSDEPYFLPHATMTTMVAFYRSMYPRFSMERYTALREAFGLSDRRQIRTFSKGMQRQVAVILALSSMPDYLFCDETFDGLDPVMRQAVKRLIIDDVAQRELCCITATHNLRELEDMADHIALLHKGELLFSADTDEIRTNIVKVQVSFAKEDCDRIEAEFAALHPLQFNRRGSLFTAVLRGTEESVTSWIRERAPQFCEFIPLTLEEVFITEMEERNYDFAANCLG